LNVSGAAGIGSSKKRESLRLGEGGGRNGFRGGKGRNRAYENLLSGSVNVTFEGKEKKKHHSLVPRGGNVLAGGDWIGYHLGGMERKEMAQLALMS